MMKANNIEQYKNNYVIARGLSKEIDPVSRRFYEGKPQPNPTRIRLSPEHEPMLTHAKDIFWKTSNTRNLVESLNDVQKLVVEVNNIIEPTLGFRDLPNIEEINIFIDNDKGIDGSDFDFLSVRNCPNLQKIYAINIYAINQSVVGRKRDVNIRRSVMDPQTYYNCPDKNMILANSKEIEVIH